MLVVGIQRPDFFGNGFYGGLAWAVAVAAKTLDERFLSEFLTFPVMRFRHSVGVECHQVSRSEFEFVEVALPILKESQ
jgi:hypothetical protein